MLTARPLDGLRLLCAAAAAAAAAFGAEGHGVPILATVLTTARHFACVVCVAAFPRSSFRVARLLPRARRSVRLNRSNNIRAWLVASGACRVNFEAPNTAPAIERRRPSAQPTVQPSAPPRMPARINPNPVSVEGGDPAEAPKPKKQQVNQLTACIRRRFDFERTASPAKRTGKGHDDADARGARDGPEDMVAPRHPRLQEYGDEGAARRKKLTDVVPIDPRVGVLLNAIVKGLVGMRDFVKRSMRKEVKEADIKRNRAILNVRRKIMLPCLRAWCDLMRNNKKLFRRSVLHCKNYTTAKAWRTWRDGIDEDKEAAAEARRKERQMKRVKSAAQRMMNGKVSSAWNR